MGPAIRYTGQRIKRLEDPRLLRGRGCYVADLVVPGMVSVAFVRSSHAHARIVAVDADAARRRPRVLAVVTAKDLEGRAAPLAPTLQGEGFSATTWAPLSGEHVRFCGEAIAAVVADDPAAAVDAREDVRVEYEALPATVSIEEALAGGHVLFRRSHRQGDPAAAFAAARVVLRESFSHARCAPMPLEPRGVIAYWDGDGLTVWSGTQSPHILRTALAAALGLAVGRVRVIVPDVGGGFGLKTHVFPEDVAVAAIARQLGRPVRWIEERREQILAGSQARGQRFDAELAADGEGRVLGLRARVVSDAGAYHIHPLTQALEPLGSAAILPGPYRTDAYEYEALAVRTNKPPLGAYRGVGMTMGVFVMERLLDLLAGGLGLDPGEVRRRNLISPERYPFTSASGMTYDSGNFPAALEQALALAGYDGLRREQARGRAEGRALGIGLACYTEYTGMGAEVFRRRGMDLVPGIEAATVTMDADGEVRCAVSFPSQGQGHATTVAQIVADRLGVPLTHVRLEAVDTLVSPAGSGTFGSRGAVAIHGTVAAAAEVLRRKLQLIAAHALEASPADLVVENGGLHVRGVPDRALSVGEVAKLAYAPPLGGLPLGLEPGLTTTVHFDPREATFSGAVHVAAVEVDPETGRVRVRSYTVVEDCGPIVNPLVVDGQVQGAVAQGVGEALLEAVAHDEDGQLVTGTLMDYALPRADDVPGLAIGHLETPAPSMPGGVKGMGEGGTIGSPAAIANAVANAVGHLGVRITALPIDPEVLALTIRRHRGGMER